MDTPHGLRVVRGGARFAERANLAIAKMAADAMFGSLDDPNFGGSFGGSGPIPIPSFEQEMPDYDLPEPSGELSMITVRVDLQGVQPPVWRRVRFRSDVTLADAAQYLIAAMGWQGYHLHHFYEPNARRPGLMQRPWYFVTDMDEAEGDAGFNENDVTLGQVLRVKGDFMLFEYDFGDSWFHKVKVEDVTELPRVSVTEEPEVLAVDAEIVPALCVDGKNACPPEDVGGVGMWNELAAALKKDPDPAHLVDRKNLAEYANWLNPHFRLFEFDVIAANKRIKDALLSGEEKAYIDYGADAASSELKDFISRAYHVIPLDVDAMLRHGLQVNSEPDMHEISGLLRPWKVMLEAAQGDGIELTQAGYIKPAIVKDLFAGIGCIDKGWNRPTTEVNTPEVGMLHEDMKDAGLLRKYKGRLKLSRLGQLALAEEEVLLRVYASFLTAYDDEFDRQTALLTLLFVLCADQPWLVGDGGIDGQSIAVHAVCECVSRMLASLGWSYGDNSVPEADDVFLAGKVLADLGLLGMRIRYNDQGDVSLPTAQYLAKRALWPNA